LTADGTLRDDLMEHHDYEAVPPLVWKYLVQWYGFQENEMPIMRLVSFDRRSQKIQVDMNLEHTFTHLDHLSEDTDMSRVD